MNPFLAWKGFSPSSAMNPFLADWVFFKTYPAADWTPGKYCSCGYNKFMFLMYQVGAGTSMFALGKTLSLFCKTAASLRFCSRFIIININTNYSRSSKSSMQIIFIISAHLFAAGIALCRLSVFFPCRNDQKDGVSFWAQIHDPGTEVVTQPAGAGTAEL